MVHILSKELNWVHPIVNGRNEIGNGDIKMNLSMIVLKNKVVKNERI